MNRSIMSPLRRAFSALRRQRGVRAWRRRFPAGVLAAAVIAASDVPASPPAAQPLSAEETRLNTAVFREGLRKRGLLELLELHMKDFPPESPAVVALMAREVKLAEFGDASLSRDQRQAAIDEANHILEKVIDGNPDDPRRFQWTFSLAQSLLYDQVEPIALNALYGLEDRDDRPRLAERARQALAAVRSLAKRLTDEYRIIDQLSAAEFEKRQGAGYVDELDRIAPTADYLLAWALFYDALSRRETEPAYAAELNEIIELLAAKRAILETPHSESRVQIPALLLGGMTLRRLNDHHKAREFFDRTRVVAERLDDADELAGIQWALVLVDLESVRNDRDDGRWSAAETGLARLRAGADALYGRARLDPFVAKLAAAILERSVLTARAEAAEKTARGDDARSFRARAALGLAALAEESPSRRDDLYAVLFRALPQDAAPESLDAIDRVASMAGLLAPARDGAAATGDSRRRAIEIGESLLEAADEAARRVAPEALRLLAIAYSQSGEARQAAERFLRIARDFSQSPDAPQAALAAVQLTAGLTQQPRTATNPDARSPGKPDDAALHRDALAALMTTQGDSEPGKYWRFFYAQALDEAGEHSVAAEQYALVSRDHEHHLEALYLRVRAFARSIRSPSGGKDPKPVTDDEVRRLHHAHLDFVEVASADVGQAKGAVDVERLRADESLTYTEMLVLPPVAGYEEALRERDEFERKFGAGATDRGRSLRIRLAALEGLGRREEAAELLPAYAKADPSDAGRTLQTLYDAAIADVEACRARGDQAGRERNVKAALATAEQLAEWAQTSDRILSAEQKRRITTQWAEALLQAGGVDRAKELFQLLAPPSPAGEVYDLDLDVRILFGYAQTLFLLNDLTEALPRFNRLAVRLPAQSSLRWQALVKDLECRTRMGEPPEGIIKVIEQQKFLYPELGGAETAKDLQVILQESARRKSKSPGPPPAEPQ